MEVSELTSLTFSTMDCPPPFCIHTGNHTDFTVNNRAQCDVIQLRYDTTDEDNLKLLLSVCTASSTDRPTAQILSDPCEQIDRDAKQLLQLEDFLLKPTLLSQLAPDQLEVVHVNSKFCDASATMLGSLNSFGSLRVYKKRTYERRWTQDWADLSALWLAQSDAPKPASAKISVAKYVQCAMRVQFVAFAWDTLPSGRDGQEFGLVAITASGMAVFFSVASRNESVDADMCTSNARIVFTGEIPPAGSHHDICHALWHSTDARSYLLTGDTKGNVCMYTVNLLRDTCEISGIHHLIDCVQTNVPMLIGSLHMEWWPQSAELIVIACIASKVIVCYLDTAQLPPKMRICTHSLPRQVITGFARLSARQFTLCTATGLVQILTLDSAHRSGIADITPVQTTINTDRHHVAGLAVSHQQALWLFVLFPRKPFDHLVLRHPLIVSVCTPPVEFVLQRLRTVCESQPVSAMHDCVEVFRYRQLRQTELLPYEALDLDTADGAVEPADDRTVYALRLHLMMMHSVVGFYRRQSRPEDLTEEIVFVQSTLLAIAYYRQLVRLMAHTREPTASSDNQKLAVKCLQNVLAQYTTNTAVPAACAERYGTLGARLRDAFVELTIVTDDPDADAVYEHCNQCDEPVVMAGSTTCAAGHSLTRCCISAMLVPIISTHGCKQCSCVALESVVELQHVMREMARTVFMCPVCDVPLDR